MATSADQARHERSATKRTATRWRLLTAVGTAATAVVATAAVPSAQARVGSIANPSKVVVKVVTVPGFGSILETKKRLPLYVDTAPPCTGGCLTIWPPLLMPGKKTIPLGANGLGTTLFGTSLQVTYNGQPLYVFLYDMKKKPPTGNGVQDFAVVTVG